MKKMTSYDLVRGWQSARYGLISEAKEDESQDNEEELDDPEPKPEKSHEESPEDSLDNQLDSFFIKFEKDAIDSTKSESKLFKALGLIEAKDDEEEDNDDEETDDDVTHRGETDDSAKAVTPPTPDMNIDVFTNKIARLINNYDSLLDVPGAIRDRAIEYLEQNYSPDVAQQFLELLDSHHDISFNDDDYPEQGPPAFGAQGEGGGSGGGGGSVG